MERATQDRPHFVLVPWQGGISHIIPMTDIGRLLASHGAAVTVITTPANAPLVRSRVEDLAATLQQQGTGKITVTVIPFPAVEAGLPEGCERLDLLRSPADVPRFFAANRHFGEAVARYCRGDGDATLRRWPSCVVAGMCHSWALVMARELGVPCYVFHGFGAFALLCVEYLYKHRPHKAVSSADELVDIPVLPAFGCRVSRGQLPPHFAPSTTMGGGTMQEIQEFDVTVDGVIVNTFDELEHGSCQLLNAATGKTVVAVGPVSLCRSPDLDRQAMADDARQVMEWLDTKETRSVVYVSFGSAGRMPPAQLMQLGMALASCPWLVVWVVNGADAMPDDAKKWLRESFDDDNKRRVETGTASKMDAQKHRATFLNRMTGRCYRCLATDHRVANCRDPISPPSLHILQTLLPPNFPTWKHPQLHDLPSPSTKSSSSHHHQDRAPSPKQTTTGNNPRGDGVCPRDRPLNISAIKAAIMAAVGAILAHLAGYVDSSQGHCLDRAM